MRNMILAVSLALFITANFALADNVELCDYYYINEEYEAAVEPCTAAAEQGDALAQFNLGLMYGRGEGVPQNISEQLRRFQAAAVQGYAPAQNNLGVMFEYGHGVVQNYVRAHMWFNISVANELNQNAINNRNRVATLMTLEQIAEAQDLALRCVNSDYTDC